VSLFLGIDIGTSGVKAVLLEDSERVVAESSTPVAVSIPRVGWSEQSADLWVEGVFACLDRLMAENAAAMAAVGGIGLSGQMLAALLLDTAQRPLRPAILWNDQRAGAECELLLQRCPDIGRRTNGAPDPGITAAKLLWLRRHEPEVVAAARMLLLPKDYVRLALTGELASEPTDAGGTQLLDCAEGVWDPQLCEAAEWPFDRLPPLLPSWAAAGSLRAPLAKRWGMRQVPVAVGAGDNMASTLGVGAATPGDAVLTVGTSAVACAVDAAFRPGPEAAILTSAHAAPGTFLSMAVVMSATASLDWAARLVGTDAVTLAAEAVAFADNGRLADAPLFLPCLTGIRTPLNRPDATARIDGLHPGVDRGMLGYAAMEGVAFQLADCVAAQRSVGIKPARFAVVGGGARSELWVKLIATAVGEPMELPVRAHVAGPAGAARLAAVAAGAPPDTLLHRAGALSIVVPDGKLGAMLAERKERFSSMLPV